MTATDLTSRQSTCNGCGAPVCGRQRVISRIVAGHSAFRCLDCLSIAMETDPEELCARVGEYLARRPCYQADWRGAQTCVGSGQSPCCPGRLEHGDPPPVWYRREMFQAEED